VLRHYKDGRGVAIHGGEVDDGENVGCENAVHHECKGISYILEGENFSTLNTKPGRKLRLALRDGRGLALEHADVDASEGHRAYHIRMTSAAKAIEVEFKSNGEIVVTAGHHHLGFTLDLWEGTRKLGNRQYFSDWHGDDQWQLNADDGTISPRGARHLVLGWREHAQLVKRGDAAQLQFIRPGNEGRDDKGSFLSDQSDALVDTLSVKTTSEFRAAMLSKMLCIFLETPTVAKAAAAALRLLEVHGAKITDEVRDGLKTTLLSQARIVELTITHAQTWKESREQAETEAGGGLATCEQLRRAGVSAGHSRVHYSATRTSFATIFDGSERPIHMLSFAVPFMSIIVAVAEKRGGKVQGQ